MLEEEEKKSVTCSLSKQDFKCSVTAGDVRMVGGFLKSILIILVKEMKR